MTRVIGLTGGIASGKSTVARLLRGLGAEVIDADQLARDVVAPGQPALAEIAERFGSEVIAADGSLDRERLGAIVFADDEARRALEAITHPRIREASVQAISAGMARGSELIVYEAPLLVEKAIYQQSWMDALIVVSAPPEVQLARVMARDGLDRDAAAARLAAQLPLADKIAVADHVIDNAGELADLEARVAMLWSELQPGPRDPDGPPDSEPDAESSS